MQHNAKVYLAARSEERAMGAISDLKVETGKEAIWLPLDLADLASVKKAAENFLVCVPHVHAEVTLSDRNVVRRRSSMSSSTMRM